MAGLIYHPGYWLRDDAAGSFNAAERDHGRFIVNDAGRTIAEQQNLIDRWNRGDRAGLFRPAMPATASNHVRGGGLAVDIGDWQRFRNICENYGFRWLGPGDPVHFDYVGGGSGGSVSAGPSEDVKAKQHFLNVRRGESLKEDGEKGPATTDAFKRYQQFLRGFGYDGAIDGEWGAGTEAAHSRYWVTLQNPTSTPAAASDEVKAQQHFLNVKRGEKLVEDGVKGPATTDAFKRYQEFLKSNYGYSAGIDGEWGQGTQEAHARYWTDLQKPAPAATISGQIAVDGDWGEATTTALQKVLNVPADGQLGPVTYKALQRLIGTPDDGDFGPNSKRALQAWLGVNVDGDVGPQTVRALQERINSLLPKPAPSPTPAPATGKLVEDGVEGPETVKALQRKLGDVTVDGDWGTGTSKSFQAKLGVAADGDFGFNSIRALQSLVGATIDGQKGADTIKKLQIFLNSGRPITVQKLPEVDRPTSNFPQPAAPTYPGATWWGHSVNSSPRQGVVQGLISHHYAAVGVFEAARKNFMERNNREVSPNWSLSNDGRVDEIVPPDNFRAWTTGPIDHTAVTIEMQNKTGAPEWGIDRRAEEEEAKILLWASRRYNFPLQRGEINADGVWIKKGYVGHNETPAGKASGTFCPGNKNLDWILARAQELAKA